jgi:two-component system cell cycle sensor histidine kinase/response regulator CckA
LRRWFGIFPAVLLAPLPAHAASFEDILARLSVVDVELFIMIGLGVIAVAIVAALVSMIRLRRAYALQHDIFGAVPQPHQVVDETGRTLLVNDAFIEFFGESDRPAPELLAEELAGEEDAREQLERLAAKARGGNAGYMELRVRPREAPDGPLEWRYVAAYPVAGRPGTVLWMVHDITLRRQMEQVIKEEQERFVDLLENAPVGFYSVDAHGRFLFANKTLSEWLGLSLEDMENSMICLHDVIADTLPAGTPAHHPFAEAGLDRGEVALVDGEGGQFLAAIGQDVVRDGEGKILRTRSVVHNRSRERAAAEALERSALRFERFFIEAPVGIALLDNTGNLTECNGTFARLLHQDAGKLVGRPLTDLVKPEHRERVSAALKPAARPMSAAGESSAQYAVEANLVGDKETVCSIYLNAMTGPGGEVKGFIAHFIDMSEQKRLEEQFAQSQKMQAVGQLAGGIAHDFNNLLTAMIGFSDLLLLRHRPTDPAFSDIMQIKQNANRAANLVRQLLAFSRQQTLQPRRLNLTDILAELSHLLRRLLGENMELQMVHGRDLGTVRADQGQLEQVIINLAVNARDAMPDGGTLEIRTSNVSLGTELKRGAEAVPPGDYVLVEVQDNGSGIAPENLDRIFDPFFSTKEVGAGTGLGLSTVYGIVKQTGGFVFVDSKPGVGTTFSIYLPQSVGATSAVSAAEEQAARPTRDLSGMSTVLLVEDEDAVRSFAARALRNKGYEVIEAQSGEVALDVIREKGDSLDILVTDVVMPRVDGPTLVREVRETHPDLKVIFISGYTEDAFRKKLGEEEGIHFLPKPFSLKQLAAKVKEVIEEGGPPRRAATAPEGGEATGHEDAEAATAAGRPARKLSTLSPTAATLMKATLNGAGHSNGHALSDSPGSHEAGE